MPLKSWSFGPVVLIGDAAHASTPNLGQGRAQAIEDSWVLAEKIATCQSRRQAFDRFQASRFAKAQKVVDMSWQIGKVTNLSNSMACKIRDTMMCYTPSFVAKQQFRFIYNVP